MSVLLQKKTWTTQLKNGDLYDEELILEDGTKFINSFVSQAGVQWIKLSLARASWIFYELVEMGKLRAQLKMCFLLNNSQKAC